MVLSHLSTTRASLLQTSKYSSCSSSRIAANCSLAVATGAKVRVIDRIRNHISRHHLSPSNKLSNNTNILISSITTPIVSAELAVWPLSRFSSSTLSSNSSSMLLTTTKCFFTILVPCQRWWSNDLLCLRIQRLRATPRFLRSKAAYH